MIRILLLLLLTSSGAVADDRDGVKGFWSSGSSIFEVYEEEGVLYARIVALLTPLYTAEEMPDAAGEPRRDRNNPDPALRDQPILGLHMLRDYAFTGDQWQGQIYDPESGNTYQSRMRLNRRGELEIRGYIGLPMFGRTAVFIPASACTADILVMLAMTDQADACANPDIPADQPS